jgi:hypothetical protein
MVISYINLLGCIGWILFLLWGTVATNEFKQVDTPEVIFLGLLLITAISGIYLFAIGRNSRFTRLNKLKLDNAILEKQIEQAKLRNQLEAMRTKGDA